MNKTYDQKKKIGHFVITKKNPVHNEFFSGHLVTTVSSIHLKKFDYISHLSPVAIQQEQLYDSEVQLVRVVSERFRRRPKNDERERLDENGGRVADVAARLEATHAAQMGHEVAQGTEMMVREVLNLRPRGKIQVKGPIFKYKYVVFIYLC